MAKANLTLQLGNPLWGPLGLASQVLCLSLPWHLPWHFFSLGLWLPQPGGSPGGPRQELRHRKGHLGQAVLLWDEGRVLWPRE